MNSIKAHFEDLKKNWEKALMYLCGCMAAILLFNLLLSIVFGEKHQPNFSAPVSPPADIFGDNAFTFLHDPVLIGPDEDPFRSSCSVKMPQKRRVPRVQKSKPVPVKPKKMHIVQYNGWMGSSAGKKMGFIRITELPSGRLVKSTAVSPGDTVGGMTVSAVDEDSIILKKANGEDVKIATHKTIRIEAK